jgi:hypothetical protein
VSELNRSERLGELPIAAMGSIEHGIRLAWQMSHPFSQIFNFSAGLGEKAEPL